MRQHRLVSGASNLVNFISIFIMVHYKKKRRGRFFQNGMTQTGWRFALTAIVFAACTSGCVTRRLTIRSNPPGALVYVDDYKIGTTPISHNFIYYGDRKIRLVKDGYETLTVMQPIPTPWYEIPPLDFVSENFVPGEIRDHRTITYQLTPQCITQRDQLLARAEGLRGQVQAARSTSVPSSATSNISIPTTTGAAAVNTPIPPPWNAIPPTTNTQIPAGQMPTTPEYISPPEPTGFGPRDNIQATPSTFPPAYSQPGIGQ